MDTPLIDSNEVARRAGRSTRWVQTAVADGRLTVAQRVRRDDRSGQEKLMFNPLTVAHELAAMGVVASLDERVKVFLLGLVRRDRNLAEAIWQVLFADSSITDAANRNHVTHHGLRAAVARYRGDVQAFVAESVGRTHEAHE